MESLHRASCIPSTGCSEGGLILCELTVAGTADSCVLNDMESLAW